MRKRKAKQIFRAVYGRSPKRKPCLMWKPETLARMQKKMHGGAYGSILIGDIYEDCSYHPVRCRLVSIDGGDDTVMGVSLIDGTEPRCCSLRYCGVIRMTEKEAEERISEFRQKDSLKPSA